MTTTIAIAAAMMLQAVPPAAPADDAGAMARTAVQSAVPTAGPVVGAKVQGPDGSPVGTVSSVTVDSVVVDTGTTRAAFAPSSFTPSGGVLLFGLTRAQVEEEAAKAAKDAAAATTALFAAGAVVVDEAGGRVGRIESVSADSVVVATGVVRASVPKASFASHDGTLVIGLTKTALEAAAGRPGR